MSSPSPRIEEHIGLKLSSDRLEDLTNSLFIASSRPPIPPEVKSYSDVVYFNYHSVGLSLLFVPTSGYKLNAGLKRGELQDEHLVLESVDIYNTNDATRKANAPFDSFPLPAIGLRLADSFEVQPGSTGKDFVASLGEPDRKGGGSGPSNGSIGIWCEWTKAGVLVEFGGDEARGPHAWDRAKDAGWRVLTIFRRAAP